jgi:hypothetical protein
MFREEIDMRLCNVWDRLRPMTRYFCALLTVCAVLPANVAAQEIAFVVVRYGQNYQDYELFTLTNCKQPFALAKAGAQVACTLQRNECEPGKCKFDVKSTDYPPLALTFGVSSFNPTCGWVWDPRRQKYIYVRC